MWWRLLVCVVAGIVVFYVALIALLWRAHRRDSTAADLRDALRLLPDLARLLRRLAADPALPRGVRTRLLLLMIYLASPVDLIPDFIPVLGYADDAIIVALTLRSVIRRAGPEPVERHWSGTPEGLQAIRHLAESRLGK